MPLVLDASVLLRWYFEAEDAVAADLLRTVVTDRIMVPVHWRSELANGIVMGERRGRSHPEQVEHLTRMIDRLDLELDGDGAEHAFLRILPLARAHRLTVYDAVYLELAERRGLPLATYDESLSKAARFVGLRVLGAEAGE